MWLHTSFFLQSEKQQSATSGDWRRRCGLICLRLVFSLVVLFGAEFPASAQIYRFKSYTSSSGLPSNVIYSMFQDSRGFLWIGTDSGLCCYDGAGFQVYSKAQGLPDTNVRAMCEDKQGQLWVTTEGGVSRFTGNGFETFTTAQGLSNNRTYSATVGRDGTLWFGTANGLNRFDGKRFTAYGTQHGLPAERIWALLEDSKGTLWIGQRGGGLIRFQDGVFTTFNQSNGLADDRVFGLAEDPAGGLWITTSGGLCFFNGSTFRIYTQADGLGSNSTDKVFIDRYHRVWCSTFGGGLCRFENGQFVVFNRAHGLLDNYLTALLQDREGNIWCGTRSSGVCRLSSELFASYTSATGITNGTLTGVAQTPDSTLWFSSLGGGLSSLSKAGEIRLYGVKEGLPDLDLWTVLADSQGRIWMGGARGIACLHNGRITSYSREQIGARDRITAIIEDRQGRLWFGSHPSTSNGVVMFDGTKFQLFTTEQGLPQNPVSSFTLDADGTLLACSEGGLSQFDGVRFVPHPVQALLEDRRIRCVYVDEQKILWIGSLNGLFRYDGTRVQHFTRQDGLASDTVRAIISLRGEIWIGTSGGISVYDGKTFRNYTTREGLLNDEIFTSACLREPDGTLWFGTNDGALRYRAMPEIAVPAVPKVMIRRVLVRDEPQADFTKLQLPYNQNTVQFDFVGVSLVDEEAVVYRHQLEGFERGDWSEATRERSIRFTNLPPGQYVFRVQAGLHGKQWGDTVALELTVQRPFWQTWWFGLVVLASGSGIAFSLYRRQIRQLERRETRKVALLRHIQEQRLASLRELLESIRTINSQLDVNIVLQHLAEEGARLVNGEPGGIGLVENGQVVFRRLWLGGRWEEYQLRFQLGEAVAGKVAETGKAVIVNDPTASPEIVFPELIQMYYVNGWIDVPIVSRTGKIVGVLDVRRGKDQPLFGDSDRQLIESLANQAAIAIENAGLYSELEEKNLQLEEKNLTIAESFGELERLYKKEQEITQTLHELNRMKTNFMIVTSHEMRTPLTVLKGYIEALVEEYLGPLTFTQRRSLDTCQRMVERMVVTFDDILEMLKINEGRIALRPNQFDLTEIVRKIVGDLQTFVERRKQQVFFDAPDSVVLSADQGKIQMVLINVIQNAIKFTHDGGTIHITLTQENDWAKISIADSGIGISAEEVGRIFEKFYTSQDPSTHTSGKFEFSARGTGLGLAIAKSYVDAHGGRIWAESEGTGKGTTVFIHLPFASKSSHVELPKTGKFNVIQKDDS